MTSSEDVEVTHGDDPAERVYLGDSIMEGFVVARQYLDTPEHKRVIVKSGKQMLADSGSEEPQARVEDLFAVMSIRAALDGGLKGSRLFIVRQPRRDGTIGTILAAIITTSDGKHSVAPLAEILVDQSFLRQYNHLQPSTFWIPVA